MTRRSLRLATGVLMALAACSAGDTGTPRADREPPSTAPSGPATSGPVDTTSPPAGTGAACPAIPARAEPRADRPRYVLTVDAKPDEGLVQGSLKVAFTPDLPTDELVFRLWPNGPRPALGGAGLDPGPVTVDGQPATVTRADPTTMVVKLGRMIVPGTKLDIATTWTLRIPGPANDRLSNDEGALRLGSFFPILSWEPGVGWAREAAVGDFAEAASSPTADFDLSVTVPAGFGVLASGEPVPAGSNHFVAIAMRDVAVSIGRFDRVATAVALAPDPVQVSVGVHTGVPGVAQAYLDEVVAVLEDSGRRYGPYPWTTFTLAITPGLGGGIEYPGHVMQGPGTLGGITTHEVGHMWFYGLVGNNQGRDPWLDEGITTWAEVRYQQQVASYTARQLVPTARGHLDEPMAYWTERPGAYLDGVYVQGAQALASLGPPDLVDCALRVYVARNAHRIATPADLVAAASAVFPIASRQLAIYGVTP